MSDTTTTTPAPGSATEPAVGRSVITPYICATPAAEAIDWYVTALGAVEVERYVGDDGRVGHAMLRVGGAELFLSDEYPDYDAVSPATLGGTTVSLHLVVPDVDAVYERAVAPGARGDRPPADQPYGDRSSTIVDPFGHRWMISTPIANPTVAEINDAMSNFTVTRATAPDAASTSAPVELGYFTLPSPDTARASRFYGALFGWTTEPGGIVEGYAHVNNTQLPFGFVPADPATPRSCTSGSTTWRPRRRGWASSAARWSSSRSRRRASSPTAATTRASASSSGSRRPATRPPRRSAIRAREPDPG